MTLALFLSRGNNRWLGWKRITQTCVRSMEDKMAGKFGRPRNYGWETPLKLELNSVIYQYKYQYMSHIPYTIYQNMSYTSTRVVKVLFGVLKNSGYCWVPQYTQIFWTLKCLCIHIGVQFSTGLIPAVDHTWYKPDNQLTATQYHWWITNKLL